MDYLAQNIQDAYDRWCEPGDHIKIDAAPGHFVAHAGDRRSPYESWIALWCGDDHLGNYLGAEEAASCLRSHLGGCDA